MDASKNGRCSAQRQWMPSQPIVPSLVFAACHVRTPAPPALGAAREHRHRPHPCTTKVLPLNGPVHIDPARGTRDSLPVFPGESTS
ncbi:hypothetical protein B9Y66_00350 [Stenotrophomonas maltophilia]|nr:hypothetical protein B9Y66_00350 [Stenotrophomonas maltophilia]